MRPLVGTCSSWVHARAVKRRPSVYRAPSWSWASVETQIVSVDPPHPDEEIEIVAQILEVRCVLVAPVPYGQVSSGYLRLTAPAFWTTLRYGPYGDQPFVEKHKHYVLTFKNDLVFLQADVSPHRMSGETGEDDFGDPSVLVVLICYFTSFSEEQMKNPAWKYKEVIVNYVWNGLALRRVRGSTMVEGEPEYMSSSFPIVKIGFSFPTNTTPLRLLRDCPSALWKLRLPRLWSMRPNAVGGRSLCTSDQHIRGSNRSESACEKLR